LENDNLKTAQQTLCPKLTGTTSQHSQKRFGNDSESGCRG